MADDFNIKSVSEWDGEIRSLEAAKQAMEGAADLLKSAVKEQLTQYGITGDIATSLMTAYDADITPKVTAFEQQFEDYIKANKDNSQGAADAISTITNAVSGMR